MKFILKKTFYIPVIALILIFGAYRYFNNSNKALFNVSEVKLGLVSQEVSVSGTVKDKGAVELGFEKTGRIRKINVEVGQKVFSGEVLLALENGVETSALEDAEAKLASKEAHYADLKAGGSPEEISVKEGSLAKAEADLGTEYAEVQNLILDSFNKADNAVRRQADIMFSNPLSANPQLSFNSSDQQAVLEAQNGRFIVESNLINLKKLIQNAPAKESENEEVLAQAKLNLLSINDFLIKTNRALNSAVNLSDTVLATNKDALNTARTNINTAITNVTSQIQTITTQKITVRTTKAELALIKAGATAEVLAGTEADIKSADANVKNARAVLAKTYIISPISGIVTKQDAKVGQIASANIALVAVASGNYEIEAFVPEVDIAKIAIGNSAEVTLDAYGSDLVFPAHVIKIDPAETILAGVSTYKTTLSFDEPDEKIRSGMTANTVIATASKQDVLTVPQRAIYDKNGKKFVRILKEGGPEEREVVVGLKGSGGTVEIVSGLSLGEQVVTSGKP